MVTAFQFSYGVSRIVIISFGEEGDDRFVGHLLILWQLYFSLAQFYLELRSPHMGKRDMGAFLPTYIFCGNCISV